MRVHKKEAYDQALSLRRRGFTYSEIATFCNVSKATVSNWCRHEPFSKQVAARNRARAVTENTKRLQVINKARHTERRRQYAEATRVADLEYKHYRHNLLFIAGLTLYLSVGDLSHERIIRVTNNRPELHRTLIKFLVEYLAIKKSAVRCWLLLYPVHDEVVCIQHWCKQTGLSPAQFYKNQYTETAPQKAPLHFGVGNTIIGSTLHKKKLMRWLQLLKKELAK
jgi:hypothetical protein